jgi:alkylhydroperoxidase family enzyme
MRLAEAVAAGEDQARLPLLAARHHAGVFSDREQAALAWTETVTRLPDGAVPDGRYEQVRAHFSDEEVVKLTMAVVAINGWNRLNVAFETLPACARR